MKIIFKKLKFNTLLSNIKKFQLEDDRASLQTLFHDILKCFKMLYAYTTFESL